MKHSIPWVVVVWLGLLAACTTTGGGPEISDEQAATANMNLGAGYLRQERPDAAVDALERAVRLDPRLSEAHSLLAMAYDQLDEPELAEEQHRRATQLDPANPEAQNRYAVFLCRHDRWEDARRYFDRAGDDPRYELRDMALTNAGICARQANDLTNAEAYFRRALEVNPVNKEALSRMVELSYQTENYLQSRAFLQRLSSVESLDARKLLLCYLIEHELGDSRAAENCANELSRQFPSSPELRQLQELVGDARQ
jgi:type IV pilus assembly protein PilF